MVVEPMKRSLIIFLMSAPSGTGKGTIVSALLEEVQNLSRIVTTTSRLKREGEIEGISYYFIPRTEFERLIREGAFVEWNRIYGDLYGTKKDIVERFIKDAAEKGHDLILEIDVDGKRNFAREYGDRLKVVSIFLLPPSREELERRIKSRKADSPAQMRKRLARAKMELARHNEYDYRVVNDSKDAAVEEIKAIIARERVEGTRS
jgi:guanylate kinase